MTTEKLIERARNAKTSLGASLHFGLCAELADCVEKLEAEIAELRQQLAEARGLLEDCSGWLHADHTEERFLLRKIGEFLKCPTK